MAVLIEERMILGAVCLFKEVLGKVFGGRIFCHSFGFDERLFVWLAFSL